MLNDLKDMALRLRSGMRIALPVDYAGVAMAMTRPMIDSGLRDLRLVCVPTGGLQVDMLIGAGCVAEVETSAVSLGEAGGAPLPLRWRSSKCCAAAEPSGAPLPACLEATPGARTKSLELSGRLPARRAR